MNKKALILRTIKEQPDVTQRELASLLGSSLGSTNKLLKECTEAGLLSAGEEKDKGSGSASSKGNCKEPGKGSIRESAEEGGKEGGREKRSRLCLTKAGEAYLAPYRVDAALILSAGFGSRFVPLTYETPKGLLEVFGEPMIERQIRQLHEAGITDITIMVGYLKEKFEYLQDKYGVRLLYNPEYADKNTLATIYHAKDILMGKNVYILSSDNWMRSNLYHAYEGGAWYSAAHTSSETGEWVLLTDKKGRITDTFPGGRDCWYMYGPAYFSKEFSASFLPVLAKYYEMPGTEQYYWEHVLMEMLNGQAKRRLVAYFGRLPESDRWQSIEMYINPQPEDTVYEFENIEELRLFDRKYENDSGSEAMQLVSRIFQVPEGAIQKIRCLKAGMTNHSWLFDIDGKSYICRIPGEGTEKLIDRRAEKAVYEAVSELNLTERLIYFDEESGYKISRFYENSRNSDLSNETDLRYCMKKLRLLHRSGARVPHRFDIGQMILYYELLCIEETDYKDSGLRNLKRELLGEGVTRERAGRLLEQFASFSGDPRKKRKEQTEQTEPKEAYERAAQRTEGSKPEEMLQKLLQVAIPFADYTEIHEKQKQLCAYLASLHRKEALSHIDAVSDNFIFLPGADISETERDESRIRLIDWEYAAMCDPLIDLAMCSIYSYMNEAEAARLRQFYFEREPSVEEENVVYAYMALGGLLWALWGVYKEKRGVQFSDYTLRMYRYFKTYYGKLSERISL